MKIVLAGDFPREQTQSIGGIQNALYNLVEGFSKKNNLLEIFVLSATATSSCCKHISPNVEARFLRIPKLPQTLNALTFESETIKRAIKEIKPDVVHAHNMTGYSLGAIQSGYPCLITPHGHFVEEAKKNNAPGGLRTIKILMWQKIHDYILTHGLYFNAISPYVKGFILQGNPGARVFSISDSLSDIYFSKQKTSNVEKTGILWSGRICKSKRLDLAIRAYQLVSEHVPNLILEVAGEVDENYKTEFNKIKSETRGILGDRVRFLGHLNREDMIEAYDRALLVLLTSEQETFSMVLAEAMARGIPVISSDIPGVRHMIDHDKNGLYVSSQDSQAYADAIISVVTDEEKQNRYSEEGKKKAKEFTTDRITDQLLSAYHIILGDA